MFGGDAFYLKKNIRKLINSNKQNNKFCEWGVLVVNKHIFFLPAMFYRFLLLFESAFLIKKNKNNYYFFFFIFFALPLPAFFSVALN